MLFLSLVCYTALSLFYFSPVAAPCKIVYPVALLFLCSLFHAPYAMSAALFFSLLGDYMGAVHNFWGQMGFLRCPMWHLSSIFFLSVRGAVCASSVRPFRALRPMRGVLLLQCCRWPFLCCRPLCSPYPICCCVQVSCAMRCLFCR